MAGLFHISENKDALTILDAGTGTGTGMLINFIQLITVMITVAFLLVERREHYLLI